jgi:hypothetical protein
MPDSESASSPRSLSSSTSLFSLCVCEYLFNCQSRSCSGSSLRILTSLHTTIFLVHLAFLIHGLLTRTNVAHGRQTCQSPTASQTGQTADGNARPTTRPHSLVQPEPGRAVPPAAPCVAVRHDPDQQRRSVLAQPAAGLGGRDCAADREYGGRRQVWQGDGGAVGDVVFAVCAGG